MYFYLNHALSTYLLLSIYVVVFISVYLHKIIIPLLFTYFISIYLHKIIISLLVVFSLLICFRYSISRVVGLGEAT
jgi:hypothetical protein